jgi:hypothetical protein
MPPRRRYGGLTAPCVDALFIVNKFRLEKTLHQRAKIVVVEDVVVGTDARIMRRVRNA